MSGENGLMKKHKLIDEISSFAARMTALLIGATTLFTLPAYAAEQTVNTAQEAAASAVGVLRNTAFTTSADMQKKMGSSDLADWSPVYLTSVENIFWTYSDQDAPGGTQLTLNIAKNAYRNLNMLLDNGYTMDYNELAAYAQEYLGKKNGVKDAFYNTLASCLNNPYLLNRPAAKVTATTYNGRDYSKVFDAAYYYKQNPDLQASIGNHPAALLKQFVEEGINQGRQGNASFQIGAYKAQLDAQVLASEVSSPAYLALQNGAKGVAHPQPLGIYSYSLANYYGHYLGWYGSTDVMITQNTAGAALPYQNTSNISVYTGLPVTTAQANQRPLAVMMPTDRAAQPSYGISRADILYEVMEEGEISRQMAIIPQWEDLSRIGNLRSCRLYYIYAAKEWDPILIHFGGVGYMKGTIDGPDMNNLSGTYEYGIGGAAPGAGFFFRSADRSAPHNAYISAAGIIKAAKRLGYSLSLRSGYYNPKHFNFGSPDNTLDAYGASARTANIVDLRKIFPYSKSKFLYDPASGVYLKQIHGRAQTDAINGKQISFANVIIQNTNWRKMDKKGYLGFDMLGTTQDGWYCTKGKAIHITWKKTSDYEPTRYYDDNGNEITMTPGKTYIGIAQQGRQPIFTP